LLGRGIDYFTAFVCENLGGKDERITRGDLADVRDMKFDPLNILILKRKPNRPDRPRAAKLRRFGNPDDVFAQSRPKTGLITQAEVRAVANVGTVEMLTATYAVLKRLGGGVEVLLVNLSRGVEQLESLRFEAVNPTFLLRVQKPAPDWVV